MLRLQYNVKEKQIHAEPMEKKGIFYNLVETQSQVTQIIGIGAGGEE